MSWINILTSSLGAIVGASVAIAGIYIQAGNERKKSVKTWYEEKYISSVDGLMEFFTHLRLYYLEQMTQLGQVAQKPEVPIGYITNLQSILPDSGIDTIVMFFHAGPRDTKDKMALKSFLDSCKKINTALDKLREGLLNINLGKKETFIC